MSQPSEIIEIERLYNALEEDRITDAEATKLKDLLRTSAVAREEYLRLTEISVSLRNYAAVQEASTPSSFGKNKIIAFSLMAAAATIILAFTFISRPQPAPSQAQTSSTALEVTGFASLEWTSGKRFGELSEGARIETGVLELTEDQRIGITMDSGTTIALAGPAKLDLLSATQAHLYEGRVKIHLHNKKQSFTLKTDEFQVTDLGTEFGVWANPTGPDEAHVMEGSVDFLSGGVKRVLKAGESVSGTGKTIAYSPGFFHFGKDEEGDATPTSEDISKLAAAKLKRRQAPCCVFSHARGNW